MRTMHLTNYAINKNSDQFNFDESEGRGSKRSLSSVLESMRQDGCDASLLWRRICEIVNRTLVCVQPALQEAYRCYFGGLKRRPTGKASLTHLGLEKAKLSACFEILGFDVLVDRKLRPWLLEVNHAPSFAPGSALDRRIKHSVLQGALEMLCPTPLQKRCFLTSSEKEWKKRLWTSRGAKRSLSMGGESGPPSSRLPPRYMNRTNSPPSKGRPDRQMVIFGSQVR